MSAEVVPLREFIDSTLGAKSYRIRLCQAQFDRTYTQTATLHVDKAGQGTCIALGGSVYPFACWRDLVACGKVDVRSEAIDDEQVVYKIFGLPVNESKPF